MPTKSIDIVCGCWKNYNVLQNFEMIFFNVDMTPFVVYQ